MEKTLTNFTALLFVVEKLFFDQQLILLSYTNKTVDIVEELLLKPLPKANQQYITYNSDHQNIQSVLNALENQNLNDLLLVTILDNDSDFNNDNLFKNKVYFVHLIIIHQPDVHKPISSKLMETLNGQIDNYNPVLILWNEEQPIKSFSMCTPDELRPIVIESIANLCDRSANFMGSSLSATGFFNPQRMMFLKRYDDNEFIGTGGRDGYFLTLLAEYFNATISVHIQVLDKYIRNRIIILTPELLPYTQRVFRATWVPPFAVSYSFFEEESAMDFVWAQKLVGGNILTGQLFSEYSAPSTTPMINTIADLQHSSLPVQIPHMWRDLRKQFRKSNNMNDSYTIPYIVQQVFRRNINEAYILPEELIDRFFTDPWFFSNGQCFFHLIPERLFFNSIHYNTGRLYMKRRLNQITQRAVEHGLFKFYGSISKNIMLTQRAESSLSATLQHHNTSTYDLKVAFHFFIFNIPFSLLAFIGEILWHLIKKYKK